MGMIRLPEMIRHAKQIGWRRSRSTSTGVDVPKGHLPVYVGEEEKKKRFIVPITHLNHPMFRTLLRQAEEEFGIDHQMGALTIPYPEDRFIYLTSQLNHFL